MRLHQIANILDSKINSSDVEVKGIEFDSRSISENDIFVALPDTSQNSHDFIKDAENKGAVAAIVSTETPGISIPQIKVSNTINALSQLSMEYRKNYTGQVIALTGSTGKTTIKEMIASILQVSNKVLYTHKNYNNHIGVPHTMCKLSDKYDYCVLEMGANHVGEIKNLTNIAKPNIAILNNLSEAHIGEFGSMENIAKAKAEIFSGLTDKGTKIINHRSYEIISPYLRHLQNHSSTLLFSKSAGDITAKNIHLHQSSSTFTACMPNGTLEVSLNLPGEHSIENALAAISATCKLVSHTDIAAGLEKLSPIKGRLVTHQYKNNSRIIDDTYNAAPKSVIAAIEYLASLDGNNILVLGDLGELGKYENRAYEEIAERAKQLSLDQVITCGKSSYQVSQEFSDKSLHFDTKKKLVNYLKATTFNNTNLLIKGARFMQMDQVVSELL